MILEEKINGLIFVTQTTYYVYRSEEDQKKDHWLCMMSDEKAFSKQKEIQRKQLTPKSSEVF